MPSPFPPIRPRLSAPVAAALAEGRPVVALESTVIAQGLPYPHNVECARCLAARIAEAGAVPATIAVIEGELRAGLSEAEITRLARDETVAKLSRRDLPIALAEGTSGATTVAATLIGAAAGIPVFATGGIGGVHRGWAESGDISADLDELARQPVAVVCAGAKAILDLPATLEALETRGVPVLGHGTDDFPAFYSRKSGLGVDRRVDSPAAIARIFAAQRGLGLAGGLLVANPVPEAAALPREAVESAIAVALAEAEQRGVSGKEVTPFLLSRLARLTGGESLTANLALLESNASLGARIAGALAELDPATELSPCGSAPRAAAPESAR